MSRGDDEKLHPLSRRAWMSGASGAAAYVAGLGCGEGRGSRWDGRARSPRRTLRVWAHQGQEAENTALRAVAASFARAHQPRSEAVELSFFPDHHYIERLSVAAAARELPDAFELDGPLVARFVDAQLLMPLEPFLSEAELGDFLPSIRTQGSIDGRLYALGAFESAAVLYLDRERLAAAGVTLRPGGAGPPWVEFVDACERLSASGIRAVALHMGESADEWFTYAFSPLIWSGGGRLIDATGTKVRGVLASPENVASLRAWQGLFERGFASSAPVDPDPFGSGAAAMDWSGHWMARQHLARKGRELDVMGLPRFRVEASACGSFCWAISLHTEHAELAGQWLRWVTDSVTGIQPLVAANGGVPARRSAFAAFPEYGQPPYALFREQLERSAHPRPRTRFYGTLTREFAGALRDIARGAAVSTRLERAEREVAAVIARRLGAGRERDG
jgi:ABC-type glycerol-3-phosphate transport system substrate-binding protein